MDPALDRQPTAVSLVGYVRRKPESTALHEVVREHLETFLAQAREDRRGLLCLRARRQVA